MQKNVIRLGAMRAGMQVGKSPRSLLNCCMVSLKAIWNDVPRLRRLAGLLVALLVIGLNAGIRGTITLDWQHLYRPEDFHSWGDLWDLMAGLQTGISPFWAFLEVSCQLLFGTTAPFSLVLYPLAMGWSFYLGVTLFSRTKLQLVVAAGASVVFAVAIRYLHKANPQIYDVLMPALILSWVVAIQRLQSAPAGKQMIWAIVAGLLLSVLELTRTLIFPLMPFLLVLSFLAMRRLPIRHFAMYLLPILLLSGSWHLKQIVAHGQTHWSNHDGFNMQKSWVDLTGPLPTDFVDDPPLYEGGFDNINTDKHTAYNKVVRKMVREAVLKQPGNAVGHFFKRLLAFYKPKTELFMAKTPGWFDLAYRPLVWLGGLATLVLLGLAGWRIVRRPRLGASWLALGDPVMLVAAVTALISAVFAVGEVGEEARFMISLLPLLVVLLAQVAAPQSLRK